MRRFAALLAALLLLAGCGGGASSSSSSTETSLTSTTSSTPITPAPGGGVVTIPGPVEARPVPIRRPSAEAIHAKCVQGQAVMGCATSATPNLHRGPGLAIPPVPLFPDVSVWQGAVNWGAVASWQRSHGWHPTAIWKMGEYTVDRQASRNASETARLGFYRAGYWFVRNTGCSLEAGQIIGEARAEGLSTVVEDNEVPEARGYAACLTPRLRAAGFKVVLYSSPGANPDSSNPGVRYLWVAAYGPQHVPCLFTCSVGEVGRQTIVAWQLTDGVFGFVTRIPGIGADDVSADYGIGKVLAGPVAKPAAPADPYHYRVLTTLERDLVLHYDGARKHPAKYVGYLKQLEAKLSADAHQVWVAAHAPGGGGFGARNRGIRFQVVWVRSLGRQVVR